MIDFLKQLLFIIFCLAIVYVAMGLMLWAGAPVVIVGIFGGIGGIGVMLAWIYKYDKKRN